MKNALKDNLLSGEMFVFVNRRKNQMKVLYFERSGYCIGSKKLEQGQFVVPSVVPDSSGGKRVLNWTELKLLLEGIEINNARQFKRYLHPS